jgi:hypothetical protein
MRRLGAVITSVLVLGGMGFVASPAWGDRDRDFKVTAKVTDIHKDDNGRDGPSPGDRLTFNADLFRGNRVGRGDGTCVITDDPAPANDFISKCGVTFELPDGNLRMEGKIAGRDFGNGEFTIPVVGGTGDFKNAVGEAHFAQVDDSYGSGSGYRSGYSYGYDSSGYYPYADTNYSAQSAGSDPTKDKDKGDDNWKKKKEEGGKHKDGDKAGEKRKGGDESAHKDWGNRDHHEGDHHDGDRHDGNRDGHRDGDRDRHDGDRDRDHRRCWDCYNRSWDRHRGCWDCYDYYDYYDRGYHSCYDYGYSCGSYYNGHDRDYRNYPVFDVAIHLH